MSLSTQVKDTKDNGVLIECKLLGDGSDENPYRPEVFDKYDGYYHFDTKYMDKIGHTCKIWVNKKKTSTTNINKIKNDVDITVIKETNNGSVIP